MHRTSSVTKQRLNNSIILKIMSELTPSKPNVYFKDQLKKDAIEKKKNILYLIHNYLVKNNLSQTAETLQIESLMVNDEYELCENIDLEIILQEFMSYYQIKYQKLPKIVRKSIQPVLTPKVVKKSTSAKTTSKTEPPTPPKIEFDINITPILKRSDSFVNNNSNESKTMLNLFNDSADFKELAEQISKDIIDKNIGVNFRDCVGLESAIESLKEAVIYPKMYPNLFDDFPTGPGGVLLYGPPGTGKTLLAKALACESDGHFINVTSSTFISKWRGDSEKMLKILFKLANANENTIIFIDEIDALCSTNNKNSHEASLRFKSELLTQIDGITQNNVFILGTTNSPWDIDSALLRRFEKRIFVPLPNFEARLLIFKHYFSKFNCSFDLDCFRTFANMTSDYSGADIKIICKEAKMGVVRKYIKRNVLPPVCLENPKGDEVVDVIKKIKSCITNYERYIEWHNKFGTVYF